MITRVIVLSLLCCCVGASTVRGAVEWSGTEVTVHQRADQESVSATFTFVNKGERPVQFLEIKKDCGCTSTTPDKDSYIPGQTGELKVVVSLKPQVAAVAKRVLVTMSDDPESRTILMVHIIPPPTIEVVPAVLIWGKDEPLVEKTVRFSSKIVPGLSITDLVCDDKSVTATFERIPGSEDKRIRVRVTGPRRSLQAKLVVASNLFHEGVPVSTEILISVAVPED